MDKKKILEELGGLPEEVYDDLCRIFIDDAREKLAELQSAWQSNDYEKMKLVAHALKGASSNLRISAIHEIAVNLEQAVKNKAPQDDVRKQVVLLEKSIEAFKI